MSDEQISQTQVNKALRVLNGTKHKYTVRIYFPDGKALEFQSEAVPVLRFLEVDRCMWLQSGPEYASVPCMKWVEGSIMMVEENPK